MPMTHRSARRPLATTAAALLLCACSGHTPGVARSPHQSPPTAIFVDQAGQVRLALRVAPGPSQGTFALSLPQIGILSGQVTLPPADNTGRLSLNATASVTKQHTLPGGTRTAQLTIRGDLHARTLDAALRIHLDSPPTDATLNTGVPDVAKAQATANRVLQAVSSDLNTIAGLLAPDLLDGRDAKSVAAEFATQQLTGIHLVATGPGHLTKLDSGLAAWVQPFTGSAMKPSGVVEKIAGNLVLVDEMGHWWLLTTTNR